MSNKNNISVLLKGIIKENPVFVLVLGTCPSLAMTKDLVSALGMGLSTLVVLICSNIFISLLRKIIPDNVRIPCYIVIIATFVTVVQLVMHAILPELYEMMGVYLALIVVNCIILGRAEMFARKNNVLDSVADGLGMGLGFLVALVAMATIREVFGAGTFAGIEIPFFKTYHIPILNQAPGGFLVFGILIAVMNKIKEKDGGVKRKFFSCEGCPSAAHCKKASCAEMIEVQVADASEIAAKEEPEHDA